MKRRQFLQRISGATLLPLLSCSRIPQGPRKKIVIVGAGLAGLSAAWELEQMGHEVTILEATQRVGGRVLTSRGSWAHDQYVEWGATRIADVHDLTLHYVRLFGLSLDELPLTPKSAWYFSGQRYDHPTNRPLPKEWGLKKEEEALGLDGVRSLPYKNVPKFKDLDGFTFTEYVETLKLSSTARNIARFESGSDADHYSAALWQNQATLLKDWIRTFQIHGGNDQLPAAFAKALNGKIHYGTPVKAIERREGKSIVSFHENGVNHQVIADVVVLTVAPSILKSIEFKPGLSEAKVQALSSVKMGSVIKTSFGMKKRFWNEEGLSGLCVAYSDLPIERIYDLTATQKGEGGILMSYSQYHSANELRALGEKGRIDQTLSYFERIFPKARKYLDRAETFDWNAQDWVKGPWISYTAHQLVHYQALKSPEQGLHFAGDHTSIHCGWMQGALESGQRVAREI